MKTLNRMALGTISSLLLAAGFYRTAQKFDPLTKSIGGRDISYREAPSTPCIIAPCLLITD
jgi:hypothetical protein